MAPGIMRRCVWITFTVVFALSLVGVARFPWALAADIEGSGIAAGSLIKGALPAVYYYSADGKRYVFPNEKTYRTWYGDFAGVRIVDAATLAAIPIGGNVTYRPGARLVKVVSDPKVYTVARGGALRHVVTEQIAVDLYGVHWTQAVEDIPDAFFTNYTVGEPIPTAVAYEPNAELLSAPTIDDDRRHRSTLAKQAPASSSSAPVSAPAPSNPADAARPDAPGYRTSTIGRFIRTDIVVDTDSFNPPDEELRTLFRIANNILVLRTDTEMQLGRIHRFSYRSAIAKCRSCPTGGVARGTILTPLMDLYATIPEPEFIVFFRGDDASLTYGGYAAAYQSPRESYRNRFTAARGRTRDVYVSVSNWEHRYNVCGYDRTDLRNQQHVSDVAIDGECRNRPGTPCVLRSGYWQCDNSEALASFYARHPYAFAASTAVHELMHQFGSDGNYDHYGSTRCPTPNASDLNTAQTYAVICPAVFDLFRKSFHE